MKKGSSMEKKAVFLILLIVFLVMTVLSFLTPLISDDYNYCFSFADYSRITSVGDIVRSMVAHRETTNGRIVAHSLVSLFLLMPKAVFNVANGLAAALFVLLISFYSDGGCGKRNVPVVILAFGAGAYSESISLAMLFIALCLSVGTLVQKKKMPRFLAAAMVIAALGYVFMMLSPSELSGRTGEFSVSAIARNFKYIVRQTGLCLGGLYCAFMMILAVAVESELGRERKSRDFRPVIFSLIVFVGGLGSIAAFTFAKYFPDRAMCASACWTIVAGAVLLSRIFDDKRAFVFGLTGVLTALFAFTFVLGVLDVAVVHKKSNERLAQIAQAKADGEQRIVLEAFTCDTKYSPIFESPDVADGENEWPNDAMAWYYGFESVSGK